VVRQHLVVNLTVEQNDFDFLPVFTDFGGWQRGTFDFDGQSLPLIEHLNGAVAA